jgi:hypothetical protein
MKKILLTAFLSLNFLIGYNQNVPNPGFEAWIDYGDYEDPKNWQSPNWATTGLEVYTVTKSTDTYSGNYSVRMESKNILGGMFKVPGTITLGEFVIDINNQTAYIKGGIPFTHRPDKLTGFYKYNPGQGDFMQAFVFFYKQNAGTGLRDTIGLGYYSYADTVDVWSPFETEIIYTSPEEPDSMNIIIMASDIFNTVQGSTLLIDSLMFDYSTGIKEAVVMDEHINAFPNPCNRQISFEIQSGCENALLDIYNLSGQLMHTEAVRNKQCSVITEDYPDGMYLFRITGANSLKSGRFIVGH